MLKAMRNIGHVTAAATVLAIHGNQLAAVSVILRGFLAAGVMGNIEWVSIFYWYQFFIQNIEWVSLFVFFPQPETRNNRNKATEK